MDTASVGWHIKAEAVNHCEVLPIPANERAVMLMAVAAIRESNVHSPFDFASLQLIERPSSNLCVQMDDGKHR